MSGYRIAGERMIRVDMLERLADQLRAEDSRAGFEAKADMLSITGMTLEQFADLMQGLGYRADRGERVKERPAPAAAETAEPSSTEVQAETEETAPTDDIPQTPDDVEKSQAAEQTDDAPASADEGPEIEVFYTFTWAPKRRPTGQGQNRDGGKPRKGKPRGKPGAKPQKAREFSARPARKDKIDPDNPFAAALMGLRDKS